MFRWRVRSNECRCLCVFFARLVARGENNADSRRAYAFRFILTNFFCVFLRFAWERARCCDNVVVTSDARAECAKKTNCCDCAAYTQYACVWDTNVARKRQAIACVPNAAKKRSVDDVNAAEEALQTGFVLSPSMCPCGDGNKCGAASEECDDGKNNGSPTSCCTTQCKRKPDNTVCAMKMSPLSADLTVNFLCDADDVCKSGVCTPTVVPASANLVKCREKKKSKPCCHEHSRF